MSAAMTAAAALYAAGVRSEPGAPFLPFADGRRWNLLAPRPEDLNWSELATRLACLPRFTGATTWSVGDHMLFVRRLVSRPARPYALLHDAGEGLLGDWTTPVKRALGSLSPAAAKALGELEWRTAAAIHAAAGIAFPPTDAIAREVMHADAVTLATERRDLFGAGFTNGWGGDLPPPASSRQSRLKGRLVPRKPELVRADLLAALVEDGLAPADVAR